MAVISIPKELRERLGEDGVDALVSVLSQVEASARDASILVVEERFERRVSEEGAKINMRITEEVAKLRAEISKLDNRITEEVAKLRVEVSRVQSNLIKWMFVFWLGQVGAIIGILFAFFRR